MNDTTCIWVALADIFDWPLVVLLLVGLFLFLFRGQLAQLIDRITRLKLRGDFLDISIDAGASSDEKQIEREIELQLETEELAPQQASDVAPQTGPMADFVWDGYEHFAVIESWRNLELEIVRGLSALGIAADATRRVQSIPRQALKAGLISDQEFRTIARMQKVRNLAAHEVGRNIDPVDARQYVAAAKEFIENLRDRTSTKGGLQ